MPIPERGTKLSRSKTRFGIDLTDRRCPKKPSRYNARTLNDWELR
jgi:hypothetical protein